MPALSLRLLFLVFGQESGFYHCNDYLAAHDGGGVRLNPGTDQVQLPDNETLQWPCILTFKHGAEI